MKWLFAKLLPAASRQYERLVRDRKRALFASLSADATVVELGPGTGPNFRYYPPTIHWTGIEPNGYLNPALEAAARGFDARILRCDAASLPLPDASADAVVCTLVLCSVADPRAVLRESLRILRPGGRFYFLEHVGAPRGSRLRFGQRVIDPFWRVCADGCRACRDTGAMIEQAGFGVADVEMFSLPLGPLAPHIMGCGVKPGHAPRH